MMIKYTFNNFDVVWGANESKRIAQSLLQQNYNIMFHRTHTKREGKEFDGIFWNVFLVVIPRAFFDCCTSVVSLFKNNQQSNNNISRKPTFFSCDFLTLFYKFKYINYTNNLVLKI